MGCQLRNSRDCKLKINQENKNTSKHRDRAMQERCDSEYKNNSLTDTDLEIFLKNHLC